MIYLWFIFVLLRNCGKLRKYFILYFTWDLFKNSSCHFCFARFFPLLFEECSFLDFELAKILHIAEIQREWKKLRKKKRTFQLFERKLNINLKHIHFHFIIVASDPRIVCFIIFSFSMFLHRQTLIQTEIVIKKNYEQQKKFMKEIQ